jgi:hypothetical protein
MDDNQIVRQGCENRKKLSGEYAYATGFLFDRASWMLEKESDSTVINQHLGRGLPMNNLKVALLQLMPEDTLAGNQQKGFKYCRKAKEMGADIALFPEMWSVGYNIPEDIFELKWRWKYDFIK